MPSPMRPKAAKKAAAAIGATIKEIVWTQGQYNMIAITEVSDEVGASAFTLNTLKLGNVRAQTLRAFTAAEMAKILEHVA
ncbi:MAG: GYD domain-containing protein [Beijerinckiaceae bacterium]